MKKILLLLICFPVVIRGVCQGPDTMQGPGPEPLPLWTIYVPGASCFYQKQYVKGAVFSALEIGGVWLGLKYDHSLRSNSTSPYYNYPLFLGLQAFQTEKLANFRSQMETIKYNHPDFRYHDISEKDLYLAPFKKENLLTPITGGMILMAGVFLGVEKYLETHPISEVKQMYFMDRYIPRNDALAVFSMTSLAMSWNAGVGEEYICRNWFLPLMDHKYGQRKGLIYSSLTFGILHFSNLLFAEKPDFGEALLQVGEATIAGYFLGRSVQKRDYHIGPAVAAHMWYDAVLMIGSFLINPENNFLGVSVQLRIR